MPWLRRPGFSVLRGADIAHAGLVSSTFKIQRHDAQHSLLGSAPYNGYQYDQQPYQQPPVHQTEYPSEQFNQTNYDPRYSPEVSQQAINGEKKMKTQISHWGWLFFSVTIFQAIVVLAIEGYIFALFADHIHDADTKPASRAIPTYLALFIFALTYELALVWDALRNMNTIQIIGLCIYNFGLLIYSSLQRDQMNKAARDVLASVDGKDPRPRISALLVVVPCIIAFTFVCMSFLAWKLYDEFAWTIYKRISADLRMKRRYLTYQIYIALLKFLAIFFLGFTLQLVIIVIDVHTVEFALTVAVLPLAIIVLFLAAFVVRRENKPGMIIILILYLGALSYMIYKSVRMYSAARGREYEPVRKSMTIFAVITILLLVTIEAVGALCFYNFDKGLKRHISDKFEPSERKPIDMPEYQGGWANQSNRMAIE